VQANLPYVLWVTAYNSTFLLCYVLIYMILLQPLEAENGKSRAEGFADDNEEEERKRDSKTPLLLASLNQASFLVFLVANLLTGLVNISIQTMYSTNLTSIFILTLYTTICLGLATLSYLQGWKLPI
jgi:phosphatidylinositol glycan class W